jgi:TPR repeat protein
MISAAAEMPASRDNRAEVKSRRPPARGRPTRARAGIRVSRPRRRDLQLRQAAGRKPVRERQRVEHWLARGRAAYAQGNHATAFREFHRAAVAGNREAQFRLAVLYARGHGVPPSPSDAAAWCRRAAEQGYAPAQVSVAASYIGGGGVPRDPQLAAAWYAKAARSGHSEAQFRLAVLQCTGQGVPEDLAAATRWYRSAAEQGHRYAQYNLAVMLLKGQGLQADAKAAFGWCAKAAAQGLPEAQILLGDLLATGQGTASDRKAARDWYAKAALERPAIAAAKLDSLREYERTLAAGSPTSRRVAVITDTISPDLLFVVWYNYYARVAGQRNLYVVTYKDRSKKFADFELGGVWEIPQEYNDPARAKVISSLVTALLACYDYVVRGDVDEIAVPDPRVAPNLARYLDSLHAPYVTARGLEVIEAHDDAPLDLRSPILVCQRSLALRNSALNKTCITAMPIAWTHGFHGGTVYPKFNGLYIFHLKYADIRSRLNWFTTMMNTAPGNHQSRQYWTTAIETTEQFRTAALGNQRLTGWDKFESPEFDRKFLETVAINPTTGEYQGEFFLDNYVLEIPKEFSGAV